MRTYLLLDTAKKAILFDTLMICGVFSFEDCQPSSYYITHYMIQLKLRIRVLVYFREFSALKQDFAMIFRILFLKICQVCPNSNLYLDSIVNRHTRVLGIFLFSTVPIEREEEGKKRVTHLARVSTPRCVQFISARICSSSRLSLDTRFLASATSHLRRSGSYFVLRELVLEQTVKKKSNQCWRRYGRFFFFHTRVKPSA